MNKAVENLVVVENRRLTAHHSLLRLTSSTSLPPMIPGQFVEVLADGSTSTFLRRPISINLFDADNNELWLLVAIVGDGTKAIASKEKGDKLNCIFPLGNGFSIDINPASRVLLVGGGVGVAPLLFLGCRLSEAGVAPSFLLGARTADDILEREMFEQTGKVYITTEDGSAGERGFVTQHSLWRDAAYTQIYTCGPKPMMVNVVRMARERGIPCEVSLENMMACGLGACLCCVENTVDGHVCVCTEGPVFDAKRLNIDH
jgi:dihydroorotate dehydrogenase electron transfer subunit